MCKYSLYFYQSFINGQAEVQESLKGAEQFLFELTFSMTGPFERDLGAAAYSVWKKRVLETTINFWNQL